MTRFFNWLYTTVAIGLRKMYVHSDSLLSCSYYYSNSFLTDETDSRYLLLSNFWVAIAGSWMCILGGVFFDKAVVQPLTPFISLTATPGDDNHLGRITRILEALRLAFHNLNDFYTSLTNFNGDRLQRFSPYFREYVNSQGVRIPFTYLSQLTEERTRLV